MTIDDSSKLAKVYVDGREVLSAAIPASILYDPTKKTQIGVASFPMFGRIDNYRIWNVARSQAEIQEGMGRQYHNDCRQRFEIVPV